MCAHIRVFSDMESLHTWVCNQKFGDHWPRGCCMILQLLPQSRILLLNSLFNVNLKYAQRHNFNMPTEMFLLQYINQYKDTVETVEGSDSDNTRCC